MYRNFYRAPQKRTFQKRRFGTRIDASRYVSKPTATGTIVPPPVSQTYFSSYNIDDRLKTAIAARGFVQPTPIQEKALPFILEGRDVIGIANTGTGKTGAFVIPAIQKILTNPSEKVIVFVPTRELGQQIQKEIIEFSRGMRISTVLCIGGASLRYQISDLSRSPNIVIGTPGRLEDLIERRALNMSQFRTVVLDEIDRMVDMGFIDAIRRLMRLVPTDRQTLCFSATASQSAISTASSFLRNPQAVSIGTQDPSKNVEQSVVRVQPGSTKTETLKQLLRQDAFSKVLIFTRTKRGADDVTRMLSESGFNAIAIHGNKTQQKRDKAIQLFKSERVNFLVATDVAARGLDIPDITHVINYDEPATYDDYIHRIGRTGRGTKSGIALTFV